MQLGWVVVNVDYTLSNTALAPAAVLDCLRALHWISQHADVYDIDVEKPWEIQPVGIWH